jgi:hypothetical protein
MGVAVYTGIPFFAKIAAVGRINLFLKLLCYPFKGILVKRIGFIQKHINMFGYGYKAGFYLIIGSTLRVHHPEGILITHFIRGAGSALGRVGVITISLQAVIDSILVPQGWGVGM